MAYRALNEMHRILGETEHVEYAGKAETLKENIRRNFFSPRGKLYYAIDEQGGVHKHQEALGNAFAIFSGIVTPLEGHLTLIRNETTEYGVPSITPTFKRFSKERPGRHNRLIWPFVNAFYAEAALVTGDWDIFEHEFRAMAALALDEDKGNYNFYEIFDPETGKPEGGNQAGRAVWHSRRHQTWSATGYMTMVCQGICGLRPNPDGIEIRPYLPRGINRLSIKRTKIREDDTRHRLAGTRLPNRRFPGRRPEIRESFHRGGRDRTATHRDPVGSASIPVIAPTLHASARKRYGESSAPLFLCPKVKNAHTAVRF